MYKNPELSSMAKILAAELKSQGVEMKYTKALELVAKMHGARTLHVHQAALEKDSTSEPQPMRYAGVMRGSRLDNRGENEIPEAHRRTFNAEVAVYSDSILVDLQVQGLTGDALEQSDQLSLVVCVDHGRPSVYLSNARDCDPVLQVLGSEGGLYLVPTSSANSVRTGVPKAATLRALQDELVSTVSGHSRWTDAFVENPSS